MQSEMTFYLDGQVSELSAIIMGDVEDSLILCGLVSQGELETVLQKIKTHLQSTEIRIADMILVTVSDQQPDTVMQKSPMAVEQVTDHACIYYFESGSIFVCVDRCSAREVDDPVYQ